MGGQRLPQVNFGFGAGGVVGTLSGLTITHTANTVAFRVTQNGVADGVIITNNDTSNTYALRVVGKGTGGGDAVFITQSGNSRALLVTRNSATSDRVTVDISDTNAGSAQDCVLIANAGSGIGVKITQTGDATALYVNSSSTVKAPLRLPNLVADPTGAHVIGDIAVVGGKLKICTVAGTPGTWTIVGSQS